ncbi:MAG: ECF-type sigma factor [Verrucomicrobiales bacterium]
MFPDTQWTQLAAATLHGSDAGRAALSALCQTYWEPVRRFILSRGWARDEAEDLAQSFFLFAMERGVLRQADPDRGRFRTFLLAVLNNFLLSERERRRAQKRGGGQVAEPLDEALAVGDGSEPPELVFDREWALAAMRAALDRVAAECVARRGEAGFRVIGRFLGAAGDGREVSYEAGARELGTTPGALKTDVFHWRQKLREALRAEVRRTVAAPHEIDEELGYLRNLLAS